MTPVLWIASIWLTASIIVGVLLARAAHILNHHPHRDDRNST